MTLASLIRKGGLIKHMTATPATVATPEPVHVDSVAKVSTVAVAITVIYPSPLKVLEIFFEMNYKYAHEISAAH